MTNNEGDLGEGVYGMANDIEQLERDLELARKALEDIVEILGDGNLESISMMAKLYAIARLTLAALPPKEKP